MINGGVVRDEDRNKYTETRGTSSFTLTIHNTDITDAGDYRCINGFDESSFKRLNIECKFILCLIFPFACFLYNYDLLLSYISTFIIYLP